VLTKTGHHEIDITQIVFFFKSIASFIVSSMYSQLQPIILLDRDATAMRKTKVPSKLDLVHVYESHTHIIRELIPRCHMDKISDFRSIKF